MSQEDKKLLLRDLYARIPYDPFIALGGSKVPIRLGYIVDLYPQEGSKFLDVRMHNAKPYLQPMSSMTEEEERELTEINCQGTLAEHKYAIFYRSQDWLNKHHFDYRGLIEKGLAIVVTKENNPYED